MLIDFSLHSQNLRLYGPGCIVMHQLGPRLGGLLIFAIPQWVSVTTLRQALLYFTNFL